MKNHYNQVLQPVQSIEKLSKGALIDLIRKLQIQQTALLSGLCSSPDQSQQFIDTLRDDLLNQWQLFGTEDALLEIRALLDRFERHTLQKLKEKEEALNRKAANLQSVIESTDMCIGLLDEDGKLLDCNNGFRAFFREFFDHHLVKHDFLPEVSKDHVFNDRWKQHFELCKQGVHTQFSEIITTGSKSILLNFRLFPIQRDGQFSGISFFIEDLTQKNQEESLFRLLNSAVIHANDAIVVTEVRSDNKDHSAIIYVNRAFCQLTGYHADEVINKSPSMLHGPLSSKEELQKMSDAVALGKSVRTELINYKKDNSPYWVNLSLVPLTDQHGQITHWISIQRDVSESKKAEETIRQHKQFLESINRNIREAIIRTDGFKDIAYRNQAFRDLFGYQDEAVTLDDLFADDCSLTEFRLILETKGSIGNHSFLFRRKDGSTFWGLTSFILNEDDGQLHYDGAIRDITDRKEAEKVLKEKNKALEKTNEELDRFVYSASHDLRAPLASTLGLINISRITQNNQERMSYLEMMEQSLNKMDKIIQDITDYSRNARLEIECEEIHFESLITDVLQRLKYLKHVDDVRINTNIQGVDKFFTDKIRLYVILINLLSNAIKFLKYDENDPYINISVEVTHETARLLVEDNGIGIDQKHLDKIFGMFFQAARESSGSGLGLYIVKETINKLGGSIKVTSNLKQGTCFEVILPNEISSVNI